MKRVFEFTATELDMLDKQVQHCWTVINLSEDSLNTWFKEERIWNSSLFSDQTIRLSLREIMRESK